MDPKTGEILASATYPSYDGNDYAAIAASDPSRFIDPVVSSVYEPGSVFKLLTATAALQAGVVTRTTVLHDQASLSLDGGRASVQNADRGSKGAITFQDAVAWSRNVVMSKVALMLGRTTQQAAKVLYSTWTRLGFGALTGIDVAGEVPGLVHNPAVQPWQQIDLANGSFGQGVAVTLIQLATAYSAMVNGGTLPTPHVVMATGDTPTTTADRGRVMTPALAAQLTAIMERVVNVVPFYRSRTLIPGYLVGGKTGTAQIWDSKAGRFRTDVYNFSFIGFVGRTAPQLVIAVQINQGRPIINRPGDVENAVESFELFRRIATDAMESLDVPPVKPAASAPAATAHP
jgi:cell division protein FtsI/penicillin-binding protein 2